MRSIKAIIVLTLCLLNTVLNQKPWVHNTRDFLKSYLGVIKGKEFVLDNDCFNGKFDEMFEVALNYIRTLNVVKFVKTIEEMINLEKTKCPLGEVKEIFADFYTANKNGLVLKNILKNSALIEHNISKYISSDRSACELGIFAGSIMKIVTYGIGNTTWEDIHDNSEIKPELSFLQ
jgi:hypothetical protein